MARDDFFSFGDEDLGAAPDGPDLQDAFNPGRDTAIALADPPAGRFDASDEHASAAERAQRSRGDSERASSEKRGSSPRRTQLLAVAALVALALVVVRVATAVVDGEPTVPRDVSVGSATEKSVSPGSGSVVPSARLRASRQRAAEQQQARQRRAKTRRRARRSRERRVAQRERRAAKEQRELEAKEASSGQTSTEYLPPPVEAAPEAAPAPEATSSPEPSPPRENGGLQDGAGSPEFGL